jgi:hypothetical protein
MYLIIYLAYMCSECTITLVFFFFLSEMLDMVYEVDFWKETRGSTRKIIYCIGMVYASSDFS